MIGYVVVVDVVRLLCKDYVCQHIGYCNTMYDIGKLLCKSLSKSMCKFIAQNPT